MSREVLPTTRGLEIRQRPPAAATADSPDRVDEDVSSTEVSPGADGAPANLPSVVGRPWFIGPRQPHDVAPQLLPADGVQSPPAGLVAPQGPTVRPAAWVTESDPGPDRPDAGRADNRRRVPPLAAVAAALVCLVAGAVAGDGRAEQAQQQRLETDTRVYLWADDSPDSGETSPRVPGQQTEAASGSVSGTASGSASGSADRLRVTMMATGAPVVIQRVLLGAGEGDSVAPVTLTPGTQTSVDLVLHPDCSAVSQGDPLDGRQNAVVRPAGAGQSRQVPLDVLADPSTLMLSLLGPCSASAAQTSAEGLGSPESDGQSIATAPSPTVTVSSLRATPTGRLTFTVSTRGSAVTRFSLPIAGLASSRTRYSLRSSPALPVVVQPGRSVSVTVNVTAACRGRTTTMPTTYGLLLPQADTVPSNGPLTGPVGWAGTVPLEGWDDGVAASALSAAVVRDCH